MFAFIIILLVIWAVLAFLGFIIKGLLWLTVLAVVLFAITAVVGYIRRSGRER